MPAFSVAEERGMQGIALARFRKDHQELLFLRFGPADGTRRLLGALAPRVANLWEVGRFNEIFSEISERTNPPLEGVIEATWLGLGLSASGYRKLEVSLEGLGGSEGAQAFQDGMATRSAEHIKDRPEDQPEQWLEPFRPGAGVDAVLVVAADDVDDLNAELEQLVTLVADTGCEIVYEERGGTLPQPLTGHEHFGFKDGVSQPAIEDFGQAPAPGEPPALPAGEFVLGHPNNAGPSAIADPLWVGGSFGVFRRLRQQVAAFRAQATAIASPTPSAGEALSPALTAADVEAKLVGRWPSGSPLDLDPETDPGESGVSNVFDFAGDSEGLHTPRFAHIRKVNPRNEERQDREQDPAANHRMIRAGIPYGAPLAPGAAEDDTDRGLHFLAFVANLDQQFEFVQRAWASGPNFPNGSKQPQSGTYEPPAPGTPPDGVDPLIGAHAQGDEVALHQSSGVHKLVLASETVRVTAGEYFFFPSITAVEHLAAGAKG